MGLRASVCSSLCLFNKLPRASDTQPSVLRDSVHLRAYSRPSDFDSCVLVWLEVFRPGGGLGFHSGDSLVVRAQQGRERAVFQIRPPQPTTCLINAASSTG